MAHHQAKVAYIIVNVATKVPCIKLYFNSLVSYLLREGHGSTRISLSEFEARVLEESLDVFKLVVVLIFVFDLVVKCLVQLLNSFFYTSHLRKHSALHGINEESSLSGLEGHEFI